MSPLGIFGRNKLSDKEKALKKIAEITEQLDRTASSLGNMKDSVGPSIQKCIDELAWCRAELNKMLGMRDKQTETEFYRRVLQILDSIANTLKKMKYFYTYIDSSVLPDIMDLRKLIETTAKTAN